MGREDHVVKQRMLAFVCDEERIEFVGRKKRMIACIGQLGVGETQRNRTHGKEYNMGYIDVLFLSIRFSSRSVLLTEVLQ